MAYKKRVFILGAGFSKSAGMPLATELTSLILNREDLEDHEEMQAWMTHFRQRLAAVEDVPLNIEQMFDFAKYDEELWRMKQQMSRVGREYCSTPWNMADNISTWLRYMEEELVHVIWEAQQNAKLEPIKDFTGQLSSDDTVLTFNYDTLIEAACASQGRVWNHGLNDRANGGVTVLKMHGSVDWILLERRPEKQMDKFIKLFSKMDTNVEKTDHQAPQEKEYAWELWRAKDSTTCKAVIDMDNSGLSNFRYLLGLAGLGRHKPLHGLPGSAQTWFAAFTALKEADEIYVIGFSMSPYDSMTRFHFTSVFRGRTNPPRKVVIVDPNAIRMADTYSTVFGKRLWLMAFKAEDMNWQETFGR